LWPAIYNYFPRRDDLVTSLIVDAFNSLGDSQEVSIRDLHETDLKARISALGFAYRAWALTYPQRYQLIFGTPIPHYEAPVDVTVPAAAKSLLPLIMTLQACRDANILHSEHLTSMTPELKSMLIEWSQFMEGYDLHVLFTALVMWSRVHGLVSLEIGHQFPAPITDPGEVYHQEIINFTNQYLLESPHQN